MFGQVVKAFSSESLPRTRCGLDTGKIVKQKTGASVLNRTGSRGRSLVQRARRNYQTKTLAGVACACPRDGGLLGRVRPAVEGCGLGFAPRPGGRAKRLG